MVYFLPFSRSELNQLVEKELRTWQTRVGRLGAQLEGGMFMMRVYSVAFMGSGVCYVHQH